MAQVLSFWLVPQIFCSVKSFWGKKKLNNKIISKQLCPAILLITCMASGRKNKRWPACSQSCYRLRNRKRWTEITLKWADKEDPQDGDFWQQEEVLIFPDVPLQNRQSLGSRHEQVPSEKASRPAEPDPCVKTEKAIDDCD